MTRGRCCRRCRRRTTPCHRAASLPTIRRGGCLTTPKADSPMPVRIEDVDRCQRRTPVNPPAMTTRPSNRRAAACPLRGEESKPAAENVAVSGSKISTLERTPAAFSPPAIRTRPSLSSVAVWPHRASVRSPTADHAPEDRLRRPKVPRSHRGRRRRGRARPPG